MIHTHAFVANELPKYKYTKPS